MVNVIIIIVLVALLVLYIFLKRAINKHTIVRTETSTKCYTEIYENGKLIARFDNK